MLTYRSRNPISNFNSIDINKSFNSNTFRANEKRHSKNKILTNLPECAGEARIIIHNNNSLKQIISLLKKNNLYTKNFINKIITINKDIKLHHNKNDNNNNNNNIHLYKDNLFHFIKEYNNYIRKNNNILKEKIQKNEEKNENYKNDLEKEIEDLNKNLDESLNLNFMLENRNKYKDNIIKDISQCYLNLGCIQEIIRYRFVNDDITQSDADKYYSKQLLVFQQNLLNTTQNWNKYKNRAIRFEQEIKDLEKILENPKNLKEQDNDEKNEQSIINEDDLFLLTFDEFEDESREITLETEGLTINEDNNNISNTNNNNANDNIIKINNNNNINKINTNIKFNKINNIKNQSANNRRINKLNFIKRDIYYIPQKDFSKSLIKNSESVKKIISKDVRNICPPLSKNNRNVSINSISKLNLKQIVFNKENKFIKEEVKEMAQKRFKIENEFKIDTQKRTNNPNDIKIQMQIKELKKDIKTFKEKKNKKKKIIKEFKDYCKDIITKYNIYISNNDNCKYNYTLIKSITKII